jgi:hypothetical protein
LSSFACGRADLRNHGGAYSGRRRRHAGYALRGRACCVSAERNGPDVRSDERLPFGALAEADLPTTSRRPAVIADGFARLALTAFFPPIPPCRNPAHERLELRSRRGGIIKRVHEGVVAIGVEREEPPVDRHVDHRPASAFDHELDACLAEDRRWSSISCRMLFPMRRLTPEGRRPGYPCREPGRNAEPAPGGGAETLILNSSPCR